MSKKKKVEISSIDISSYADKFLKTTIKQNLACTLKDGTITHRFKSWEYCRLAFLKVKYKKFSSLTKKEIDNLSLQLSFYLASWGMYRGSSFLLGYDYKIHSGLIEILFKYKQLFNLNPFNSTEEIEYLQALFGNDKSLGICKEIENYYSPFRIAFFKSIEKTPKSKEVSYILITKILMGVYGCTPAFDRFFQSGISNVKGMQQTFNLNAVKKLINVVSTCYDKFNECCLDFEKKQNPNNKTNLYTIMKIVDCVFWQIGLEKSKEKASNAEV